MGIQFSEHGWVFGYDDLLVTAGDEDAEPALLNGEKRKVLDNNLFNFIAVCCRHGPANDLLRIQLRSQGSYGLVGPAQAVGGRRYAVGGEYNHSIWSVVSEMSDMSDEMSF